MCICVYADIYLELMSLLGRLTEVTVSDTESLPYINNRPIHHDSVFAVTADASRMYLCGKSGEGCITSEYVCQVI